MVKKKHTHHEHPIHHHKNAQAVIAFMVILIGLAVLLVFQSNQEILAQPGTFRVFMLLSTIAMALLITLVFLANQSHLKDKKKK